MNAMSGTLAGIIVCVAVFVNMGRGTTEEHNNQRLEEDTWEPLDSHSGIFRALPWTEDELNRVSEYHAVADYDALISLVQQKMAVTKMSRHNRRRLNAFLKKFRPPKVLRNLLEPEDKEQIKELYKAGEIGLAMDIVLKRLQQLSSSERTEALDYLGVKPPA